MLTGFAFENRARRPIVQSLVRTLVVVEGGVRTPTGPKNGKFYMSCIRGSVVLFASTRYSRSRVAKFSAAVVTTMRWVGGWNFRAGCLIASLARQSGR